MSGGGGTPSALASVTGEGGVRSQRDFIGVVRLRGMQEGEGGFARGPRIAAPAELGSMPQDKPDHTAQTQGGPRAMRTAGGEVEGRQMARRRGRALGGKGCQEGCSATSRHLSAQAIGRGSNQGSRAQRAAGSRRLHAITWTGACRKGASCDGQFYRPPSPIASLAAACT